MDIPRIFTITESAHRIHNPFAPEKLAALGAALRLEPGTRVLDLGSGSGEMLCTWARDHGISGVADRIEFIHGDAAGYHHAAMARGESGRRSRRLVAVTRGQSGSGAKGSPRTAAATAWQPPLQMSR